MSEYKLGQVCEHGTLARKCDLCFYQKEIAQLESDIISVRAELKQSEQRYELLSKVAADLVETVDRLELENAELRKKNNE